MANYAGNRSDDDMAPSLPKNKPALDLLFADRPLNHIY